MDSESERIFIDDEIFIMSMESANKLHVLYLFEKQICFTDSFKDTMKIINENDHIWKNYIFELDLNLPPQTDPLNEILRRMAKALIDMHIERLELDYVEKDWLNTLWIVSAILLEFWYNTVRKWPRNRHTWLANLLERDPGYSARTRNL